MKQVLARSGNIVVEEIPAPQAGPGTVLVRVSRSCISAGTEGAGLGTATLVGRALTDPARLRDLAGTLLDRGVIGTATAVHHALDTGHPLGYSLAGRIAALGDGVTDLKVGQRVACAGAGHASHAEYAAVPRNLVVPVPDGVSLDHAATVALGSIALHGVRRLEPTLGETFAVLGLGLLGQLTVQLLRANGCRVIGLDLDEERLALARTLGLDTTVSPTEDAVATVQRITGALGADGVIITAAGASDEIVSSAFRMCRPKGRVVVVGDVGLNLRRGDFYAREIEFRISTSYGPGRYDPRYEQDGLDYPIGYVRWTEARNMAEYLRLIDVGSVQLEPLVAGVHAIADAPTAYAAIGATAAPILLLACADDADVAVEPRISRTVALRARRANGGIRTAVVGAGGFARAMHLPNLKALQEFDVHAVVSRNGVTARTAASQFGAAYASTDYNALLADADVDAIVLCTRHDLHASMTLAALRAGKHVLVEKPLALSAAELTEIENFHASAGPDAPVMMTGYNRRFSPFALRIREHLERRSEPAMLLYRMNAGYLPPDHWTHSAEGGGRNIGEACHIYDLFLYLVGAQATRVDAAAITPATRAYGPRDNFTATLHFDDGSIATLVYTALGTSAFAKERLEVFSQGTVAVLDDYRRLDFHGTRRAGLRGRRQDKGHRAELQAFAAAINGGAWPIPLEQQLAASRISFQVEEQVVR